MVTIRRISAPSIEDAEQLSTLLMDSVAGGASVGFLAPLARERALAYWRGIFSALGDDLLCWVAERDDEIVGTVQLSRCAKENGSHRAEVQKLQVKQTHRGQGISTALMDTAEEYAKSIGLTLLVLDTEAGSFAETLYRHRGWQKSGEIPQYAGSPNGRLIATAIYYKLV
jgi:acetyltransferase